MDSFDYQEERLLPQENVEPEKGRGLLQPLRITCKRLKPYVPTIKLSILLISFTLNAVLGGYIRTLSMQQGYCVSEYTGLKHDKVVPYQVHSDYTHENRTISDTLWEQLDSNPVAVTLDQEYISTHNLKPSVLCPWDQSKELYQIKVFHHIHCLKSTRQAYFEALEATPDTEPSIPTIHVNHCLDMLRQDIMCFADDTPTPSKHEKHRKEVGEPRKCKDWDALVKWSREPERQSCFHNPAHT